MKREYIQLWLEREFDELREPVPDVDNLLPLLARIWDEGRLIGYNETGGDTPNPYGKPTDYAKSA